jgi:hypothetical protein
MKRMTGKWKFGKKKGARWVWKKRKVRKVKILDEPSNH